MISVIVCSRTSDRLRGIEQMYRQSLAGEEIEFIGLTDARSLAEAYNRAAAASRGEILVFSHDDIQILSPGLAKIVRESLRDHDLMGAVGANRLPQPQWSIVGPPYIFGQILHHRGPDVYTLDIFGVPRRSISNIHAVDGLFMAARRDLVLEQPFDEVTFDGFHLYDVDFSFRAHLAGKRICVRTDLHLLHASVGNYNNENWIRYGRRFLEKHGPALDKRPVRHMQWAARVVYNLDEAREAMNPDYLES